MWWEFWARRGPQSCTRCFANAKRPLRLICKSRYRAEPREERGRRKEERKSIEKRERQKGRREGRRVVVGGGVIRKRVEEKKKTEFGLHYAFTSSFFCRN
jgi:hypothetical protein